MALLPSAKRASELVSALVVVRDDAADGEGYIVVDCVPVRVVGMAHHERGNAASVAKRRGRARFDSGHEVLCVALSYTAVTSKSPCHPITSLSLISIDCLPLAPLEERHN